MGGLPLNWIVASGSLLAALAAYVAIVTRTRRLGWTAAERVAPDSTEDAGATVGRFRIRRTELSPIIWGVAVAVFGIVALRLLGAPTPLIVGVPLVSAVVVSTLVGAWLVRRRLRVDEQLADAIDFVVASLRSGASLVSALELAAAESRDPLAPRLEGVVRRLRLGDRPKRVFDDLAEHGATEGIRLFSFVLAVHWEVGGGIAPTLAQVSRTLRERIDLSRKIRAQSAEAQFSVLGVLGITYLMFIVTATADPDRVLGFFSTELGALLATVAVALQGAGIVWLRSLTRSVEAL